jgi:hypothetical protein
MTTQSNMLLTMMWEEVDRPIKEAPSMSLAKVRRIDANVLVIETGAQEGLMVGLGMFVMCLIMVAFPAMLWNGGRGPFFSSAELAHMHGGEWLLAILLDTLFPILMVAGAFGLAPYLLFLLMIQRAPSPIVCDRRAGKIYGSHKGKPLVLEWKKIKPILTQGLLLASGVQRFYNLVFFQPETPETWAGKGKHRGNGIIIAAGQAWGWGACQAMAEFIRRYMEEPPEDAAEHLPAVEVMNPHEEVWVTKLLDRGPYTEMYEPEGHMDRLRRSAGWPEISFGKSLFLIGAAPAAVMNLLQVYARRTVQLPADWWPAPATSENPYATITSQAEDLALRRKAAKIVAIWLGVCVGIGVSLWAAVFTIAIRSL